MRLISVSFEHVMSDCPVDGIVSRYPSGIHKTGIVAESYGDVEASELGLFLDEILRHISYSGKVHVSIEIDDVTDSTQKVHDTMAKHYRMPNVRIL